MGKIDDGCLVFDEVDRAKVAALADAGFAPVLQWERDGLTVSTRLALEAAGETVKVDVPALRQALAVLKAHRDLVVSAYADIHVDRGIITAEHLRDGAGIAVSEVLQALDHIIADDYRSTETRGGS